MSNKSINTEEEQGLREKLSPLVTEFTKKLLNELEKNKVLEKSAGTPATFRLQSVVEDDRAQTPVITTATTTTTTTTAAPTVLPKQKDLVENLTEFRNIINNIYYDLFPPGANHRPTYKQMLYKLRDNKIVELNWKRENELLDFIDTMDSLGNDETAKKIAQQVLDLNKINLNKLEHDVLEKYATEKLIRFFTDKGYQVASQKELSNNRIDVVLTNSNANRPTLLFEIKFRRVNPVPDKKVILQVLQTLEEESRHDKNYFFIIVFTHDNAASFTKSRFHFNNSLRQVKGYEMYKGNCRFVPVSLTSLNLVEEALHEFSREYLHQAFPMRFIQQETPQGFGDRNDHILEQNFEFKKSDFTITINPKDTKFWRFGFIFSKTDSFPRISEGRHGDKNYVIIHLCVGDLKEGTWVDPNILKLNVYPEGFPCRDNFPSSTSYDGSEIVFAMRSNESGTEVFFSASIKDKSIGDASVDLSAFTYCRIAAWCDYHPFDLATVIDINHK